MNKIRVKIGSAEIEYEGDEVFTKADIRALIEELSKPPSPMRRVNTGATDGVDEGSHDDGLDLGVESIAAKLDTKTGPDLLLAAGIFLESQGRTAYSRKDLLEAAKSGSGYYNDNVRKNLSNYLQSLVRGSKLNKRGDNQYSLNAATKRELLTRIG